MNWLKTIFRSKYTLYLEAEVERLRADNLRLYDALLVKNGMAPIQPRPKPEVVRTGGKPLPSQLARKMSMQTLQQMEAKKPDA